MGSSSLTRDRTQAPAMGAWNLSHWATRKVPSRCCCAVTQLCLTFCDPMDRSTPGFLVLHSLPEFAQTHIHWVDDAIQPSHPLSSSSPALTFPASGSFLIMLFASGGQSIGASASGSFLIMLFASGGQSIGASASVLPMNIQGWLPLGLTGLIFLQPKGLSRVFSSTTIWKYQFFGTQQFLWSTLTSAHD